jgi:hypothetical protein
MSAPTGPLLARLSTAAAGPTIDAMRRFASPVLQQRITGLVWLVTAAVELALGLQDGVRLPRLLIAFAFTGCSATAFQVLSMRRAVRRATAEPAPVPPGAVEQHAAATVRRTIVDAGALAVFLLALTVVMSHQDRTVWATGGIILGFGLGCLSTARQLAAWERRQGARVLHEGRLGLNHDLYARPA